jgi:hypothetical protein
VAPSAGAEVWLGVAAASAGAARRQAPAADSQGAAAERGAAPQRGAAVVSVDAGLPPARVAELGAVPELDAAAAPGAAPELGAAPAGVAVKPAAAAVKPAAAAVKPAAAAVKPAQAARAARNTAVGGQSLPSAWRGGVCCSRELPRAPIRPSRTARVRAVQPTLSALKT